VGLLGCRLNGSVQVPISGQEAARTLRIGIGRFTSAADADYAVAALSAARAACEAAYADTLHKARFACPE
jgi:hypothetical protein